MADMDETQLRALLNRLISSWEDEVVEFKNIGDAYPTSDIGKYFSALANEANLRGVDRAWIILGIDNSTRCVVGSNYRTDPERLQSLKHQLTQGTEPSTTLRAIHVLSHDNGRVLLFEVPSAPRGIPIAWNGHYFARAGESLTALSLDKLDEIRRQVAGLDWSAQIVPEATLDNLDPAALAHAKDAFVKKHAHAFTAQDVDAWSDAAFLDRSRLTINGELTRTALLLLGTPQATHFLLPHPAQLTWRLETEDQAYEHFGPPWLLTTTALYRRIRNVQIRILPDDALLPVEVAKYDPAVVMEALHNCIAHQDYTLNGRVVVTEESDRLTFENVGDFFEGQPSDYIVGHRTPLRYRNTFLVQAMMGLNMIDKMGYGISRMFREQVRRFFPLPDYDLNDANVVRMIVHGKVIDPAYSRVLIQKTDLPLRDVLALDRVQKRLPVDEPTLRRLRRTGLVEGRKPNLHVSASVAKAATTKADYIRTRAQDDAFYKRLITDYIEKFGSAKRTEIESLLLDKLSDALNDDQKLDKISNLLSAMRRAGIIQNVGSRKVSKWVLADKMQDKKADHAG
jgi:ATP-dependent DNA helicase RecG